jgi:hypothetical protein
MTKMPLEQKKKIQPIHLEKRKNMRNKRGNQAKERI